MPTLDAKKTLKNLLKKGYTKAATNRSVDHQYLEFWHEGKMITYTSVSHNMDDLRDGIIAKMSRQCLLSKDDFLEFARCTIDQAHYTNLLREKGNLD